MRTNASPESPFIHMDFQINTMEGRPESIQANAITATAYINSLQKKIEILEMQNTLKDRLLSVLSHDARTPINTMKGMMSLLMTGSLHELETKMIANSINDQLNCIGDFLDNILRWIKVQLQDENPRHEQFDMGAIINETLCLVEESARHKGVILKNKAAIKNNIKADKEMIKIVLRNLVSNAIKYCHKGDKVTISASEEKHTLMVSVQDTGVGISESSLNNLFSERQLSTKGTHHELGTGLGLQLCKRYIEAHSGQINVQSKQGEGSNFVISIPLAQ